MEKLYFASKGKKELEHTGHCSPCDSDEDKDGVKTQSL